MRARKNHTATQCAYCKKKFFGQYATQKFCSITCSNRFNLNNKNNGVSLPKQKTKDLAELFGILLGDGSVTPYYVKIYLNLIADTNYVPYVYTLCKKLFPGAVVTRTPRPARGTEDIQISSCEVSRFLVRNGFHPKERDVPLWIQKNATFIKATIRGLVDTEGSIGIKYFNAKKGKRFYKQITFTNKNKNLLTFVESHLILFGYSPTKNSRKNIYISNAKDVMRYTNDIGSSNPKLTKRLFSRVIEGHQYGGVG